MDFPSTFKKALHEELQTLAEGERFPTLKIRSGRWLGAQEEYHVYEFRLEEEVKETADTLVRLNIGNNQFHGPLISTRGMSVRVGFEQYMGENLQGGQLSFEAGYLLKALDSTLENLDERVFNRTLADDLFSPLKTLESPSSKLQDFLALDANTRQNPPNSKFLKEILARPKIFIWGPAGTGKTQILAELARALFRERERFLIAANTHRAVDTGLARLLKLLTNGAAPFEAHRKFLRLGFQSERPETSELIETWASPSAWMLREDPALLEKRRDLENYQRLAIDRWLSWKAQETKEYQTSTQVFKSKIVEIEAELHHLNKIWKQALAGAVSEAQVVACTLTQTFLYGPLRRAPFDTVIIDEASMAPLPALYAAAGLASKRVILIGDFRQLAPMAYGRKPFSQKWLTRDIFEVAGVTQWVEQNSPREKAKNSGLEGLFILKKQRRLPAAISKVCNEVFYHGWLDHMPQPEATENLPPEVVVYDTSHARSWCTRRNKGEGQSRLNLYHASAVVALVKKLLPTFSKDVPPSLGIITPYREQAKLIHLLLEDAGILTGREDVKIQVSTVHQFQGEERDIIIWDTVDAYGLPMSPLLRGGLGTPAARTILVALTRARKNLFVLADLTHLQQHLPQDSVLPRVLERFIREGHVKTEAHHLLPPVEDFIERMANDLSGSQHSIVLSVPLFFQGLHPVLMKEVETFAQRGGKIVIDTLKPHLQREVLKEKFPKVLAIWETFLKRPNVNMICHEFPQWRNFLHPNLLLIDERLCWFGGAGFLTESENAPSNAYRFEGKLAVKELNEFFGLGLLKEAPSISFSCPICEGAMVLMWNRRRYRSAGDFYAGCSQDCGYSRPLLQNERGKSSVDLQFETSVRSFVTPKQESLPGFRSEKARHQDLEKATMAAAASETPSPHTACPSCGAEMRYRFNPGRYLFIGCDGWPKCQYVRPYQEQCPGCGGSLVVRRSKHGIFLGCIKYPRCKRTKNIDGQFVGSESRV